MNRDRINDKLTRSICEEALERFSQSDDSLAGIIESHHIEVRDFIVLSFVCDQSELGVDQLVSALGLSRETVLFCVDRLVGADLVVYRQVATVTDPQRYVTPTPSGRTITRRILEGHRF